MSSNNFAQWKMHQNQFRLPGAFRKTVQNFRMAMRNQFSFFPLSCSQIHFWSISHDCANFPHVHAKWKNIVFQLLFAISPISFFCIHLNHLQFNSKTWSKCIAFSSSSTLFTFIDSILLLSLNTSKITLKYLQNFTKTISISCKGSNVLLEHIRHNYYSKGMKLMRIII